MARWWSDVTWWSSDSMQSSSGVNVCFLFLGVAVLFFGIVYQPLPKGFSQPWKYRFLSYGAARTDQLVRDVDFERREWQLSIVWSFLGIHMWEIGFVQSDRFDPNSALSLHRSLSKTLSELSFEGDGPKDWQCQCSNLWARRIDSFLRANNCDLFPWWWIRLGIDWNLRSSDVSSRQSNACHSHFRRVSHSCSVGNRSSMADLDIVWLPSIGFPVRWTIVSRSVENYFSTASIIRSIRNELSCPGIPQAAISPWWSVKRWLTKAFNPIWSLSSIHRYNSLTSLYRRIERIWNGIFSVCWMKIIFSRWSLRPARKTWPWHERSFPTHIRPMKTRLDSILISILFDICPSIINWTRPRSKMLVFLLIWNISFLRRCRLCSFPTSSSFVYRLFFSSPPNSIFFEMKVMKRKRSEGSNHLIVVLGFIFAARLRGLNKSIYHHHFDNAFHGAHVFLYGPLRFEIAHQMIEHTARILRSYFWRNLLFSPLCVIIVVLVAFFLRRIPSSRWNSTISDIEGHSDPLLYLFLRRGQRRIYHSFSSSPSSPSSCRESTCSSSSEVSRTIRSQHYAKERDPLLYQVVAEARRQWQTVFALDEKRQNRRNVSLRGV